MRFVQTIWFATERFDEMQALMERWAQDTGQAPGLIRTTVAKDRDHDGMYLVIAEFEDYEQAMKNSERPETDAFAREMATMTNGAPSFGNFDVVRVDEG